MNLLSTMSGLARELISLVRNSEQQMMMSGRMLSELVKRKTAIRSLQDVEFKVFSQFGDDGIIQWLVHHLEFPNQTFIEFGVSDYREANTRFLMMNDNWSGMVMDGSAANVARIVGARYYWSHGLTAKAAFIDCSNINGLLASSGLGDEIGILHIDLDGNDYWIWKCIDRVSPVLVILEYNAVFGAERAITVPYDPTFSRSAKHYSNLYFGASLPALYHLSVAKGYRFIGCNAAGNNAYFVRQDKLNDEVREVSLPQGFVQSRFRESRDAKGRLDYLSGDDRTAAIRGLPVHNVLTDQVELL